MYTCIQCKGTKTYSPLGFMQVKCVHCAGLGKTPFEMWPKLNDLVKKVNESPHSFKSKKKKKKHKEVIQYCDNPLNELRNKILSANTSLHNTTQPQHMIDSTSNNTLDLDAITDNVVI